MDDTNERSSWSTLTAILIAVLVVEIDASIVNVALPTLTLQFGATSDEIARVVLLYLLAIVSFLLILGNVSDVVGKNKVFIAGYVVFLAASVLCGLSPSLGALQGARFLQGLGGAMLTTTANALIQVNIPPHRRGFAFGAFGVFAGVGVALGPPLGGALVQHFGWPSIFFVNVFPCSLGIFLARRHLKPDEPPTGTPQGFDYLGGITSLVAITSFVLVANSGHSQGWLSPLPLAGMGLCLAAAVAFLVRESRAPQPLVDLGLFRNRALVGGLLAQFLLTMTISGMLFVFPFYFARLLALPADTIGYLLGITPVASLLASPLAGTLTDRRSPYWVSMLGRTLMAASVLAFTCFTAQTSLLFVAVTFALYGVAMAFFMTSVSSLVMAEAPRGQEGMTASINVLSIFLGNLVGVNVFEATLSFGLSVAGTTETFMSMPLATLATGFSRSTWLAVGLAGAALLAGFLRGRRPESAASPEDGDGSLAPS